MLGRRKILYKELNKYVLVRHTIAFIKLSLGTLYTISKENCVFHLKKNEN